MSAERGKRGSPSLAQFMAKALTHEGDLKDPRPVECSACAWIGARRQVRRKCPLCNAPVTWAGDRP